MDDERILVDAAAALHDCRHQLLGEILPVNDIVLPKLQAVVADSVEVRITSVAISKMLARFAGTSEEPARIAHVDLRLVALFAVHVDLVVPTLDRERAVRREGRVVRRRDTEVELVLARLRKGRHFALPFARFVAELACERINVTAHKSRHISHDARRTRHTRVVPVCGADRRQKLRRLDLHHKRASRFIMVGRGRPELHRKAANVSVARRHCR